MLMPPKKTKPKKRKRKREKKKEDDGFETGTSCSLSLLNHYNYHGYTLHGVTRKTTNRGPESRRKKWFTKFSSYTNFFIFFAHSIFLDRYIAWLVDFKTVPTKSITIHSLGSCSSSMVARCCESIGLL